MWLAYAPCVIASSWKRSWMQQLWLAWPLASDGSRKKWWKRTWPLILAARSWTMPSSLLMWLAASHWNSIPKTRRFSQQIKKFLCGQRCLKIGGTILNAVAFTCGSYLPKYLSGDGKAALEEKRRHDKALEAYQAAMAKYTCDRTKLLDWIETNRKIKEQAKQHFMNTDFAFKLYNQAHPDWQILNSLTFISPARSRNKASCLLLEPACLHSAMS